MDEITKLNTEKRLHNYVVLGRLKVGFHAKPQKYGYESPSALEGFNLY